MKKLCAVLLALSCASVVAGVEKKTTKPTPRQGGRVWTENRFAEEDGLKVLYEKSLAEAKKSGALVPFQEEGFDIDPKLPERLRFLVFYARDFTSDLAAFCQVNFKDTKFSDYKFKVTSATRTVEYEKQLRRVNSNAAAATGPEASPHLFGNTIDISTKGMPYEVFVWMRKRLYALQKARVIHFIVETRKQANFHIEVRKRYAKGSLPALLDGE